MQVVGKGNVDRVDIFCIQEVLVTSVGGWYAQLGCGGARSSNITRSDGHDLTVLGALDGWSHPAHPNVGRAENPPSDQWHLILLR